MNHNAVSTKGFPLVLATISVFLCSLFALPAMPQTDSEQPAISPVENFAKVAVESGLFMMLKTRTSVGRVKYDPDNDLFELNDVRIYNPRGYDTSKTAITFDRLTLIADQRELFSKEPVLRLVEMAGLNVDAELDIKKGLNIKKLLDSAKRLPPLELDDFKSWQINKTVLDGAKISLNSNIPLVPNRKEELDRVEFDLSGGLTTNQAVARVLTELIDRLGLDWSALPDFDETLNTVKTIIIDQEQE
ncbi:MAG: hypothetical protein KJ052_19420 [Candidatus Hydrogenedentes bacterium]|nr:hypothetical protein [Candidatus Hydrogenedentota bacterium]